MTLIFSKEKSYRITVVSEKSDGKHRLLLHSSKKKTNRQKSRWRVEHDGQDI